MLLENDFSGGDSVLARVILETNTIYVFRIAVDDVVDSGISYARLNTTILPTVYSTVGTFRHL